MKYKTILFDFDGTLLYTLKDLADATNYAISKHGYATHSEDAVKRFVGNGVNMLVARALPLGFDTPGYEDIMEDFRAYYAAHCSDNTRPYEGVLEALRTLKAQGRKLAIVTNKYQAAAEELRKEFFAESIDIIVGDHESRRRKPEPDAVLEALRLLDAEAEGAVYVGDTEVDMATAANSGLDFVAVAWGYRDYEELEEMKIPVIARTAQELVQLL